MNHRIDKESVRLLAMQIGIKATAEQLGLSYQRVRQWSSRYGWNKPLPKPRQPTVTVDTLPSNVLGKYEAATKLSLAKSCQSMAKDAEELSIRHADKVKSVAQTASIVHGWNNSESKGNTILNLGVLIGNTVPEAPDEAEQPKTELLLESNKVREIESE